VKINLYIRPDRKYVKVNQKKLYPNGTIFIHGGTNPTTKSGSGRPSTLAPVTGERITMQWGLPKQTVGLTIPLAQVEKIRTEITSATRVELRPCDAIRTGNPLLVEVVFIDGTDSPYSLRLDARDIDSVNVPDLPLPTKGDFRLMITEKGHPSLIAMLPLKSFLEISRAGRGVQISGEVWG
jgi:hypothetical protein